MSRNIKFQYQYLGNGWASGQISIGSNSFDFVCSHLFNHPLEQILNAVYQIVPGLASFPRKEIAFVMLEEPIEYRWEFKMADEEKVTVDIYEKDSGANALLIFSDILHLNDLLKALVQCIGSDAELRSNENIERIYEQFKLYLKVIKKPLGEA